MSETSTFRIGTCTFATGGTSISVAMKVFALFGEAGGDPMESGWELLGIFSTREHAEAAKDVASKNPTPRFVEGREMRIAEYDLNVPKDEFEALTQAK